MKSIIARASLVAAIFINVTYAQTTPLCAQKCFEPGSSALGTCGIADISCLCQPERLKAIAACILPACSADSFGLSRAAALGSYCVPACARSCFATGGAVLGTCYAATNIGCLCEDATQDRIKTCATTLCGANSAGANQIIAMRSLCPAASSISSSSSTGSSSSGTFNSGSSEQVGSGTTSSSNDETFGGNSGGSGTSSSKKKKTSSSTGKKIGIGAGVPGAIILIALGVFAAWYSKRRKQKKNAKKDAVAAKEEGAATDASHENLVPAQPPTTNQTSGENHVNIPV